MIKIKATFQNTEEKEKLIQQLSREFKISKISKEYKKEGLSKRIYINLKNK
ncbi:hypothetical protein CLTEP_25040 [Clostridium tepidiprofundi DSM 19306]|uniref:Uncharacterized protein n=1 Tax=Clostridium tepidiprofundi DSM 19306 TaxID=1121338 RepID=A0A151ASW1_9CLOT|nr:hypothetical protein [Clostridium tepidiprofundi]KYH30738.1 hypothetical protein CLTEP_25040 [Clostridium tepidiprofundi DSM 19306]